MTLDERLKILNERELKITDEVEQPPICISITQGENKSIIGTLGNFSMIIGKAKSRKTYLTSAIAAAVLTNSKILSIEGYLPSNKRTVVYIDTEQGRYHVQRVLHRIVNMTNLPKNEHPKNLKFYPMRGVSPKDLVEIVELAIEKATNLGLVVIDGIKDLVGSINNENEATDIMTKLMQLSNFYQIHILIVLHQNKNDLLPRGHLGTEGQNKAESVITVKKNSQNKDFSIVEADSLRAKEFTPFQFGIGENDIPFYDEYDNKENEIKEPKSPKPETIPTDTHTLIVMSAFNKNQEQKYDECWKSIKVAAEKYNIKFGINRAKEYLEFYIDEDRQLIIKDGMKYTANKDVLF